MALILDSGVLYALLDRRDASHLACRELVEATEERLIIPSPTLPEVDYFIHTRLNPTVRLNLLEDIQSGFFSVADLHDEDYQRVHELCATYTAADIGFVDAAVLAIVERLGERKLATLDRGHFSMLRPPHVRYLTLLP